MDCSVEYLSLFIGLLVIALFIIFLFWYFYLKSKNIVNKQEKDLSKNEAILIISISIIGAMGSHIFDNTFECRHAIEILIFGGIIFYIIKKTEANEDKAFVTAGLAILVSIIINEFDTTLEQHFITVFLIILVWFIIFIKNKRN